MSGAFLSLLDSAALYLAIGTVICKAIGLGAMRRLRGDARSAEPK